MFIINIVISPEFPIWCTAAEIQNNPCDVFLHRWEVSVLDVRGSRDVYFFSKISSMMTEDTKCDSLMAKTATAKACKAAAARGEKQ